MAAESAEGRGRAVALPRVDVRLLAGLALVAVSVAGSLSLWSAARTTAPVVVAARDIGSGAVIERSDVWSNAPQREGTSNRSAKRSGRAASPYTSGLVFR